MFEYVGKYSIVDNFVPNKNMKYMGTETLSGATHKCVLVIDCDQPTGVVANIASVLSMTLGNKVEHIVSHDVYDKQGARHLGITQLPVPILGASQEEIKGLYKHFLSLGTENLVLVDFSTIAQQARTYDEYEQAIAKAEEEELHYIGIGVCAEKKVINKATGNLSLLR